METIKVGEIRFDDRGLVPAVVQDVENGEVLMMAWMNAESLARTLEEGHADAVLAASRFHFEELSISDVKRSLADRGIPMRFT